MPRVSATRDLALYGKPGSGVSTAARFLRQLLDAQTAIVEGITEIETAQRLREEDYVLVQIRAPRSQRRDRIRGQRGRPLQQTYNPLHSDVRADYTIINDGDFDWLIEQLMCVVEKEAART